MPGAVGRPRRWRAPARSPGGSPIRALAAGAAGPPARPGAMSRRRAHACVGPTTSTSSSSTRARQARLGRTRPRRRRPPRGRARPPAPAPRSASEFPSCRVTSIAGVALPEDAEDAGAARRSPGWCSPRSPACPARSPCRSAMACRASVSVANSRVAWSSRIRPASVRWTRAAEPVEEAGAQRRPRAPGRAARGPAGSGGASRRRAGSSGPGRRPGRPRTAAAS